MPWPACRALAIQPPGATWASDTWYTDDYDHDYDVANYWTDEDWSGEWSSGEWLHDENTGDTEQNFKGSKRQK
jgi:hypothetical protein